ncbi:MAG: C_GCAxxG_C_C family protein, partial [Chloroflexi bacterium]|nr:C_GCAxxG_C_C family protein [Chloroflexota bacterium]
MLAVGRHLLGEISPPMFKMASILSGGVAGTRQELCGALSAGVMVIGALYGRTRPGEDETVARALAARFRERFQTNFGTTQCAPIRQRFEVAGKPGFCAPVAEQATALLLEVLAEQDIEPSARSST